MVANRGEKYGGGGTKEAGRTRRDGGEGRLAVKELGTGVGILRVAPPGYGALRHVSFPFGNLGAVGRGNIAHACE